jgi:hypothetical protein
MTARALDPFDTMRATRALAPSDRRLNDKRWLVGETLRRLEARALGLRAADPARAPSQATGGAGAQGRADEAADAAARLRAIEARVGFHHWPVLRRVLFEGAHLRDCRDLVPELVTPWRADAVLADRLRCALDLAGEMLEASS